MGKFPVHLIEHRNKYFSNDLPALTNDTFHFSLPFFGPQSETMGDRGACGCVVSYISYYQIYIFIIAK